ncbi:hypothetical protein THF1C08_30112 [Vibrio jasicida]|nr:hypothetical protein THF1C08_30112 [Vibrio jasicida]
MMTPYVMFALIVAIDFIAYYKYASDLNTKKQNLRTAF